MISTFLLKITWALSLCQRLHIVMKLELSISVLCGKPGDAGTSDEEKTVSCTVNFGAGPSFQTFWSGTKEGLDRTAPSTKFHRQRLLSKAGYRRLPVAALVEGRSWKSHPRSEVEQGLVAACNDGKKPTRASVPAGAGCNATFVVVLSKTPRMTSAAYRERYVGILW